ncbi:peptide-methionine (S)-S-oxide reductase [Oceaniferula spumae]|uniref:peptide-methionine (S)-S-oxide reductase n=1 Tax=Oceaniferula spumae TaxID=2979115 RepID=UPI003F4F1958
MKLCKIAVGGGCHWCTEAVFLALKGVERVEQGWISSSGVDESFSEGVIIHYFPEKISLKGLIQIHVETHASQSDHSMRKTYRSAVYYFDEFQKEEIQQVLEQLQNGTDRPLITRVLPYRDFKPSHDEIVNYYFKNPAKPFCRTYIDPKMRYILDGFPDLVDQVKLGHLTTNHEV